MLRIEDLTVRIAGRTLLENASATVPTGARVGLVGRNGTGKTTLFRVISGEFAADTGSIHLPPRARIGRVEQEAPAGPTALIDIVLAADTERASLMAEAEHASDPHRIAEIQTRLVDIGAHSAPARAASILSGLGFDSSAQARPASDFSGGWRMRVALAALLFAEPDILMLDEPTNYLDLEGTLWLQDYLARYPHTLVVISHDRDLLDASVEHILHLDRTKLTLYRGGYSAFERTRREQLALLEKSQKKQQEKRAALQSFVDRFRAKATKARQAQSRLKMLEKMDPIDAIIETDVAPIVIPDPVRKASPPIVTLEGVSVGYAPGKPILSRLDLRIDDDDRIGLLGSNGNGKSTFLKLICDRLAPLGGRMVRADKLKIAYFAQHQLDELRPAETVYAHLRRVYPQEPEAKVRGACARAGFSGPRADTVVGQLSGGEKTRLLLALATLEGPNLLILDEPTNHLDIDSRSALVEALNGYSGAVIIVSHDRHLLEATVDRLWLVGDGRVLPYDGDLDDYRAKVLQTPKPADKSAPKLKESVAGPAPVPVKQLTKRVSEIEARMAKIAGDIERIDRILGQPGYFEKYPENAAQASKTRAALEAELVLTEEAWLEASSALEDARA
ncbi:MAG: ABC-F family ATP-binding cassette domain-containing protein [Alphaproteobacteria bacterium]